MIPRVFQPFAKVWTSRIPDSNYSSIGGETPPQPIVIAPLITESGGTGLFLLSGSYSSGQVPGNTVDAGTHGLFLESATYTS
jgi:hypothetical protein